MKIKVNEIVIDKNGREWANLPWIKEGACFNHGKYICNLGYACDGCPYNKEDMGGGIMSAKNEGLSPIEAQVYAKVQAGQVFLSELDGRELGAVGKLVSHKLVQIVKERIPKGRKYLELLKEGVSE